MTEEDKKAQKKECENAWKKGMSNIETKIFFNEWLNKAIDKDNEDLFEWCLKKLGKEWHVSRTVPGNQFKKFSQYLFENGKRIQNHEYKFWDEACIIEKKSKKKGVIKTHAYSFESKVCFVINPTEYSLIYDKNVCMALLSLKNFDEVAREYTKDLDKNDKKKFFEKDYELWEKGQELSGEDN